MRASSATLFLCAVLIVCWALTLGLTWAPCYAQVCPEQYHPLATRMHIVTFYGLLASLISFLLLRTRSHRIRNLSQELLTRREVPVLKKRISVGGLLFSVWILGVVFATTAFWIKPLLDYWTAKCRPTGWANAISRLVLTGIFAHHADILLGLLLIPVGRNSLLGRAFHLQQHTLLYAHKLIAYLTVLAVLAHAVTYYTFVALYVSVPWATQARKKLAIDVENPNIRLTEVRELGFYYSVSLFTGTISLLLMLVIVISSLPTLRRKAYNTFYYLHIIFSSLVFIGASIHSATNFYFLLPGLFLWALDWTWRLFRGDTGLTQKVDALLEDAGNGWFRITLPSTVKKLPSALSGSMDGETPDEKQMVAHPLQTYFVNVPSASKLQNHAFAAAATGSTTSGPVFLFQRTSVEGKSQRKQKKMMKKEWTWKVGKAASNGEGDELSKIRGLRVRVEGPYFPPDRDFEEIDRIICIVGGTGITGALSLAEWFLAHRMQDAKATLTIVWAVRNASTTLLAEWQTLLARSVDANGKLRLRSHISSEHGRLDVDETIRSELAGDTMDESSSAWVYISGPAGLLVAAEDVCCDIEAELRRAKKEDMPASYAVDTMSHFVAKWEV